MNLPHRVARRFHVSRVVQEDVWPKAEKALSKFNRLVSKAEKSPDKVDLKEVKKFNDIGWWLALCFDEVETDSTFEAYDRLKAQPSIEGLFAFRDQLRPLVKLIAPARFTYSGFDVFNSERLSDRMCRKTLDGVDFMVSLFKKRGVSDLLREGVTGIRLLPSDPINSSGGSYNPDSKLITLDTPKEGGSRKTFVDWMHHAFLHEFGHHVHTNVLPPEAVAAWDSPWDSPEDPTDLPKSVSQYGKKNKFEDFAETFVAFMAAPERLTSEADFRMKRTLSLSGLYGKPVIRLAREKETLMHPRQTDLLKTASELTEKLAAKGDKKNSAAPVLWKYTDPDGKEFYLTEKKMTIRSPYTGKTFTAKPERQNMGAVGKELREEAKAPAPPVGGPGGKTTTKRKKACALLSDEYAAEISKQAGTSWKV